jgi:hypothetical protein
VRVTILRREVELFEGAARNLLRLALTFSSNVDDTLCHEFTHEPMLARGGQRIHHGLEGTTYAVGCFCVEKASCEIG